MLRLNPAVILLSIGMFLVASVNAPDKPLTFAPAESVASANPPTALVAPPKEVATFVEPVPVPVEPVRCTIASANELILLASKATVESAILFCS